MMSSHALGVETSRPLTTSKTLGVAALATAAAGLAYSVAFVILKDPLLASLFLMLGGLLATPVLIGLTGLLSRPIPISALLAIMLAFAAALGTAVHGGYDLANRLHPPAALPLDVPNPVDPRGLLSFGVAGLALVILALVVVRNWRAPRWLAPLALIDGVVLIALYLARLVILDPANPLVLIPALLAGFLLNPAWYIGLALWFFRNRHP